MTSILSLFLFLQWQPSAKKWHLTWRQQINQSCKVKHETPDLTYECNKLYLSNETLKDNLIQEVGNPTYDMYGTLVVIALNLILDMFAVRSAL